MYLIKPRSYLWPSQLVFSRTYWKIWC